MKTALAMDEPIDPYEKYRLEYKRLLKNIRTAFENARRLR